MYQTIQGAWGEGRRRGGDVKGEDLDEPLGDLQFPYEATEPPNYP